MNATFTVAPSWCKTKLCWFFSKNGSLLCVKLAKKKKNAVSREAHVKKVCTWVGRRFQCSGGHLAGFFVPKMFSSTSNNDTPLSPVCFMLLSLFPPTSVALWKSCSMIPPATSNHCQPALPESNLMVRQVDAPLAPQTVDIWLIGQCMLDCRAVTDTVVRSMGMGGVLQGMVLSVFSVYLLHPGLWQLWAASVMGKHK